MRAQLSLQNISFDIFFSISVYLSFEDITSVSRTCRHLRSCLLDEEILSKRIVEQNLKFAPETVQYFAGSVINYRKVITAVIARREAYARARPKWIMTAAFGSANFLLNQGILVYLSDGSIRLLNIHEPAPIERCIYLTDVLWAQFQNPGSEPLKSVPNLENARLSLLSYCDDILVCLCQLKEPLDQFSAWLMILDLSISSQAKARQFKVIPLSSINKLFVRHNKSHLVLGTHSIDDEGSREWCFIIYDLRSQNKGPEIRPKEFTGSLIDATVTFTIYKDYFYAVSSQRLLEGIDFTSNYHCVQIPLHGPSERSIQVRKNIWRRQHTEGPINDLWSDLRLCVDEKSGDLIIIEARKEWISGGSNSRRTYYMTPLSPEFEKHTVSSRSSTSSSSSSRSSSPSLSSSCYVGSTGSESPCYNFCNSRGRSQHQLQSEHNHRRLPRHVHTGDTEDTQKTFALMDTKYWTYEPSANSWLDLIDDKTIHHSAHLTRHFLRIRVGSRKLEPPRRTADGLLDNSSLVRTDFDDIAQEEWNDSAAPLLWPPSPNDLDIASENDDSQLTPKDLAWINDLMNPLPLGTAMKAGDVRALSDERCLVYSVPALVGGRMRRALVVIGFAGSLDVASRKRKYEDLRNCCEDWTWERARWMGIGRYWQRG